MTIICVWMLFKGRHFVRLDYECFFLSSKDEGSRHTSPKPLVCVATFCFDNKKSLRAASGRKFT